MGRGLERREVFEVAHHREQHLRTYRRDVHLGQDEPQLLDTSRAARTSVAHEPRGFVIPFREEEVDRVLQHPGIPWLYSGETKTNASSEAIFAAHRLVCG